MDFRHYPLNSLRRHIGRTLGLTTLVALLAFAVFAGSSVVLSLQNGLASLEARMGADILVAPRSAANTNDLEQILIDGVPGYFYMDKSLVDEVAAVDGAQQVSPQYFLATVKAGCCSMPVQIIGIDPKTDFTIQPWIDHSYGKELERGDVAVGCNITGQVGSKIMFYGRECTIVAKLDQTGTALDNAAFCNAETIRDLIDGSAEQGLAVLADQDPADIVSTIQVKVSDDANVSDVVDNINLHVRGVRAVQSKAMTHDVAQSMAGVSQIIGALVVGIWLLAVAVLAVTFWVLGRTRTKEFGILRVLGATFRSIVRIVMCESLVTSACGAALGILIAGFATVGFSGAIEAALGLPFLLPDVTTFVLVALLTFVIALVVGMLASAVSVRRFAKVDEAHILRDE